MLLQYRDGALNGRRAKGKNTRKERPSRRRVTNERLLHLVCSMRSQLLAARLITIPEFEWLCARSNPPLSSLTDEHLATMTDRLLHAVYGDNRQAIAAAKRQMMSEADAVVIPCRSNGG